MTAVTIAALANYCRLPEEFFRQQDLDFYEHPGGYISFTYGDGVRRRKRVSLDDETTYAWTHHNRPIVPYGANLDGWLDHIHQEGYVLLVEGETDSWVLRYNDFPVLGVPGATMVKVLEREHLEGIKKVYIVQEIGKSGEDFVDGVRARVGALFTDEAPPMLLATTMGDLDRPGDIKASHKLDDPMELWVACDGDKSRFSAHLHRQLSIAQRVQPTVKAALFLLVEI